MYVFGSPISQEQVVEILWLNFCRIYMDLISRLDSGINSNRVKFIARLDV